jgi:AcrR family transcriptional regulator
VDQASSKGAARKPLLAAARAARRAAVLRQAAEEFRRTGVAAADLPGIARSVGLSRASLYNYCSGREDLARQCYLEALGGVESILHEAIMREGPALARLVGFVRAATGQDRPIAAIAAELDLLPSAMRAEIEHEQERAFHALAALILAGQRDGSIRACDPSIAARTIWGLAFWTPLGELWIGRRGENLAARMEAELPMLIERGIVTDTGRLQYAVVPIDLLDEVTTDRDEDRVEEIARTASSLFNRRGIEGVSLDDVAAALNATKGLVYHHFPSKAALVRHCFERGFDLYDRIMALSEAAPDALEQARRTLALNAMAQLRALHPMSLNAFYRRLPAADQARFSLRAAALLDRSVENARRGMRDGSQRSFDAPAVALAAAGSFLFLGRWVPGDDTPNPAGVAAEIADLLLYGLCAPAPGPRRG